MRPMYLEYPDDLKCFNLDLQYMFGDSFLIAPSVDDTSEYKFHH